MRFPNSYRHAVVDAVNFFRPLLRKLCLREKEKQERVYLAEFDHLAMLNLDNFVVVVLHADLKESGGLFFCRQVDDITQCYIVIQNSFYDGELEKVKMVGVHEFCHLMAIIYALTSVSIDLQRKKLEERLAEKVEELDSESLNRFYMAISGKESFIENIPELEDSHYRLNCEDSRVEYDKLFKHLMFSKELFDEHFTKEKQEKFKDLISSKKDDIVLKGVQLLKDNVDELAKMKSVPVALAFRQTLTWIKSYLI